MKNVINEELIVKFIKYLHENNFINDIKQAYLFHDEPNLFIFNALLQFKKGAVSSGVSFESRKNALSKCLFEAIERISLFTHKNRPIFFSKAERQKYSFLDLNLYSSNIQFSSFGWYPGYDICEKKETLLPAQLLFLNYNKRSEPLLTTQISTGAAGGFDHESTLLRCIYEVVERDAFMTLYLNKITPSRINYKEIKDKALQSIWIISKFAPLSINGQLSMESNPIK